MNDQTAKPWYKSKTKWAGILLAASQAMTMVPATAPYAAAAAALAAALGGFGIRDALAQKQNG